MKTLSAFLSIVFLFAGANAFAQQTGAFDATVDFKGESRTLSFYVPPDYDPEVASYRLLVGLHGMGDNSVNFRNALAGAWSSVFEYTIFVFPDGGNDQARDFYSPAGDEGIIQVAMDYAFDNYSIEESDVILEGFSLGGRSALKYGLDNPEKFSGLLLNTPAIQGHYDAVNYPGISSQYNYSNASKLPIAISQGGDDVIYVKTVSPAYDSLVANDGAVIREVIPGMGHTISGNAYTANYVAFLENPSPNEIDMQLYDLDAPAFDCSGEGTATLYIRNLGSEPVTSFDLKIETGGEETTESWEGELGSWEMLEYELNYADLIEGENAFDVTIENVNDGATDANPENNANSFEVIYAPTGYPAPVFLGIEQSDEFIEQWQIRSSGSYSSTWSMDSEVKKSGENSLFMFNTPLLWVTAGLKEELESPPVDLSATSDKVLAFDLAFNYLHYDPPLVQTSRDYTDTLEIQITLDCGETYETIYKKFGADLATVDNPIVNAQSLDGCILIPTDDQWRTENVDLSDYADETNARFRFVYISGMGGSINLDNISIGENTLSIEDFTFEGDVFVYPNPSDGRATIKFEAETPADAEILDLNGNVIRNLGLVAPGETNIDLQNEAAGAYFIRFDQSGKIKTEKIIVE